MNKDYYVYTHTSTTDDVVFYVGKGRLERGYSHKGRSKLWKIKSQNGYKVSIIEDNLSYEDAEDLEANILNNPKTNWELVNIHKDRTPSKLLHITDVYYDETSPTFLKWATAPFASVRKVDGIAGSIGRGGYVTLTINRQKLLAHRIIWTLHNNKEIPRGYIINHIDSNPSNNSINNLECITFAENNRRKKCHSVETTGVSKTKTCPKGGKIFWSYTGTCTINNKVVNKSFAILKYGEQEAFRLACEWRKEQIRLLNEQGAGYTDRHGTLKDN